MSTDEAPGVVDSPYFSGRNEWAVILGGSGGMGLAAARKLSAEGMHLCLVHRDRRQDAAAFEAAVREMRAHGVTCLTFNRDASRAEARDEIVSALEGSLGARGRVRLLLHALARGSLKPMVEPPVTERTGDATAEAAGRSGPRTILKEADLRATVDAMALSLYAWAQALFEGENFAADARVLGLTSEGGRRAWPAYGAVSAAKGALEAIVRSMALEFAPFGIRCNLLQPGVTETRSFRMIPGSEALAALAARRNPFHRLTRPEDVADVVYLLCRDEAAWINGAIVPVDGGESNS